MTPIPFQAGDRIRHTTSTDGTDDRIVTAVGRYSFLALRSDGVGTEQRMSYPNQWVKVPNRKTWTLTTERRKVEGGEQYLRGNTVYSRVVPEGTDVDVIVSIEAT